MVGSTPCHVLGPTPRQCYGTSKKILQAIQDVASALEQVTNWADERTGYLLDAVTETEAYKENFPNTRRWEQDKDWAPRIQRAGEYRNKAAKKIICHCKNLRLVSSEKANSTSSRGITRKDLSVKEQYIAQRARGAYIATMCQPEAAYDLSVATILTHTQCVSIL